MTEKELSTFFDHFKEDVLATITKAVKQQIKRYSRLKKRLNISVSHIILSKNLVYKV